MLPETVTRDALKDYWKAVYLANGNAEQTMTAFTVLVEALGESVDKARNLIETYEPENIDSKPDETETPSDVQVVFIVFRRSQEVDTKLASWSQAARVTTFPERFVLIGYQEGISDPVVNELGEPVPDPLIVGPDPGTDINQVLKEVYGDEFDTLTEDEKAEKYIEYLSQRSETKWLFDFEEAIRVGMGFKVDITEEVYQQGFTHLFVLGVKLSADQAEGQSLLEQLIKNHQFGDSGFSILPQGTPTNNTEDSKSGYSETEDADEAYARFFLDTHPDDPILETEERDGRWLAELLGINIKEAELNLAAGYYHRDQCEARAMNTALWNATIGYFMESMLTPVFNDWQREMTRWFFINHVSGRGRIPAIRIGNQPYGILPVTTISNLEWLSQDNTILAKEYPDYLPVLNDIYTILLKVKADWENLLDTVAHLGKGEEADEDAHEILLKTLGLHANSVEFDQRYSESFLHLFNLLKIQGGSGEDDEKIRRFDKKKGMDLLKDLGYLHDEETDPKIPILEKFFFTNENDVNKPLIDDRELTETDPIRAYTDTNQNYIEWLIDNAQNNHENIKEQKGFKDNKIPYALLYDMLRHALNLEFGNTGLNLYKIAGVLDEAQRAAARVDADFIGIQEQPTQLESKWDLIYREDTRIANSGVLLVDHIAKQLKNKIVNSQNRHLHEVIAALEHLKDTPTARLERAFVEHLDCCTYRLDAWLLGFVNLQLHAMRFGGNTYWQDGNINWQDFQQGINWREGPRRGIYLGAYGWLENLKPEDKILTSPGLQGELKKIFDPGGEKAPMKDSTNAGYVHAPSINHGLTAAVMRNAYISNASKEEAEPYKVNLSSERVRIALEMIEGIQQGQSLGALLGYQLERGLHDRTEEELDIYIYELRKVFPLRSNQLASTEIKEGKTADSPEETQRFQEEEEEFEEDKAITKIEARNVVDGLSLLEHIKKTGVKTYPFGFPLGEGAGKLKPVDTTEEQDAIDTEVKRLMNIRDAVADLAMAESVHQVVQGNYDRASGALDAYSKGSYPQLPDVVQSPDSGVSLTHRFGIHLPAAVTPGDTPRAQAEPAINKWLEDIFPDHLSNICCWVEYKLPDYEGAGPNLPVKKPVTMAQLGLTPIDLVYMLNVESDKSLTVLDDHILRFVHTLPDDEDKPRPDVEMEIKYTYASVPEEIPEETPEEKKISFFELAPLIESLRSLVVSSRPLLPTDMALQNEAREAQNATVTLDRNRIKDAKQRVDEIVSHLETDVVAVLNPLIDAEDFEFTLSKKNEIMAQIDAVVGHFIHHLHQLSQYGIPQTGFGFIYDRKRAIYSAIYKKVVDYKKRWQDKQTEFDDLIDRQSRAATPEERLRILQKAERTISTQSTIPVPAPDVYSEILIGTDGTGGKRHDFKTKSEDMDDFLDDNFQDLQVLINAVNTLKSNLDIFDFLKIETEDEEKQILVLAEDLHVQAKKLTVALTKKIPAVQELLNKEKGSIKPKEKVKLLTEAAKAIFGEDFRIIPVFTLSEKQANELQKSLNHQDQLLDHQINVLHNEFPVDEWLYGVARVREKLAAWENLVMLAEGFKDRLPLDLTPLQLPYVEKDHWLGLAYPEGFEIESDKLLYTAYLPKPNPAQPQFSPEQPQLGLLVDEWTEVIPAKKETTGLTFHYDRPNSEPPQTMLLVTPPAFTGQWQWTDIVNTLKETLELAKLRAVEPDQIDKTPYAQFLPATMAAVTTSLTSPVTIALNYALKYHQSFNVSSDDNG
jgi:hypothetical protein